jgi:hypothetical protein
MFTQSLKWLGFVIAVTVHSVVFAHASGMEDLLIDSKVLRQQGRKLRVLSLDGGSGRLQGTVQQLKELENRLKPKTITDAFDVFVGTSLGGFYSICFADGIGVDECTALFQMLVKVAPGSSLNRGMMWPIYSKNDAPFNGLTYKFGPRTLSTLMKPVMVAVSDYREGAPSMQLMTSFDQTDYLIKDVAEASIAKAGFFEFVPVLIDGIEHLLGDGEPFAKNPSRESFIFLNEYLKLDSSNFFFVSFGTGTGLFTQAEYSIALPKLVASSELGGYVPTGSVADAPCIGDSCIVAQEQNAHRRMERELNQPGSSPHYFRIDLPFCGTIAIDQENKEICQTALESLNAPSGAFQSMTEHLLREIDQEKELPQEGSPLATSIFTKVKVYEEWEKLFIASTTEGMNLRQFGQMILAVAAEHSEAEFQKILSVIHAEIQGWRRLKTSSTPDFLLQSALMRLQYFYKKYNELSHPGASFSPEQLEKEDIGSVGVLTAMSHHQGIATVQALANFNKTPFLKYPGNNQKPRFYKDTEVNAIRENMNTRAWTHFYFLGESELASLIFHGSSGAYRLNKGNPNDPYWEFDSYMKYLVEDQKKLGNWKPFCSLIPLLADRMPNAAPEVLTLKEIKALIYRTIEDWKSPLIDQKFVEELEKLVKSKVETAKSNQNRTWFSGWFKN